MKTFDYIVIGAGSAGCVIAARLSENGRHSVLLLEAGPEDSNPWIHVPLGVGKLKNNAGVNWNFDTVEEPTCAGRKLPTPRGRVLGGSSSINGMIYVRGHARDFDGWAQMGCRGWSYEDVLPYFRKSEDNERGADRYHGKGGPLRVVDVPERNALCDAIIAAAGQAGLKRNPDINGADQEGIDYLQATIRNGRRASTAAAFLQEARRRPNLTVVTGAYVSGIDMEGRRAVGVRYATAAGPASARAGREVILSAGAFGSPQLLELSGIGNPQHLAGLGIPVVHGLPAVGENLQDHFTLAMRWKVRNAITFNQRTKGLRAALEGIRYGLTRGGVLANPPALVTGFARVTPGAETPDIQYQIVPLSFDNLRNGALDPFPGITVWVSLMRPESRGNVHAVSRDTRVAPAILQNQLATAGDRATVVAGLRLARRIVAAPAFDHFRAEELSPNAGYVSDDELLDLSRRFGATSYHPVGTCRMGADSEAVVDASLKVNGIAGLRVADASIMPTIVAGNTNAAAIMIGEKAADLILADAA